MRTRCCASCAAKQRRTTRSAGIRPPVGALIRSDFAGVDAAINLAGAGLGDHRWSDGYKKEILDSRRSSTRLLTEALAGLDPKPSVLLSGSAIGFYGDTGDRFVDEDSPAAHDFAAAVAARLGSLSRCRKRRRNPHGVLAHRHRLEHQRRRARQGAPAVQGRRRRSARIGTPVPQLDRAPRSHRRDAIPARRRRRQRTGQPHSTQPGDQSRVHEGHRDRAPPAGVVPGAVACAEGGARRVRRAMSSAASGCCRSGWSMPASSSGIPRSDPRCGRSSRRTPDSR